VTLPGAWQAYRPGTQLRGVERPPLTHTKVCQGVDADWGLRLGRGLGEVRGKPIKSAVVKIGVLETPATAARRAKPGDMDSRRAALLDTLKTWLKDLPEEHPFTQNAIYDAAAKLFRPEVAVETQLSSEARKSNTAWKSWINRDTDWLAENGYLKEIEIEGRGRGKKVKAYVVVSA
jgi:hypothetical protein